MRKINLIILLLPCTGITAQRNLFHGEVVREYQKVAVKFMKF